MAEDCHEGPPCYAVWVQPGTGVRQGKKEQLGVIKGAAKGGIPGDIEAQGEQLSEFQILREVSRWVQAVQT